MMPETKKLTADQLGLSDMSPGDFRDAAHRVADLAADYLDRLEDYDVLPKIAAGATRSKLPAAPPASPEPLDHILADYRSIIEPYITHWQHPMFMAYFPSVASGPGILGEWLSSALNSNVMLWRNAPSSTELEEVVVSWLRQMLGLPGGFDGMFTDTASISSLLSIVAARHAVTGSDTAAKLRIYASTEAHSSIDKAAIVAGIGRAGVRRIPADGDYRMKAELLSTAIAEDRAAGSTPFCVVATLGTTSSTSVDPCDAIAEICRREKLWLHVDAAYAGPRRSFPKCVRCCPVGNAPTRSSSIRTSGCSRRSTRRSFCSGAPRRFATRSASSPNTCAPPKPEACTISTSTASSSAAASAP
jgi:aromatic-L-amino-acid decarboxylase